MYDHQKLENAEEIAKANSATFGLHTRARREGVKPGDYVKVAFTDFGERMWVQIVKRLPDHKFVGTLANSPICTDEIKFGDEIMVGAENIYDIMDKEDAKVLGE